jgi:hypothetical protein
MGVWVLRAKKRRTKTERLMVFLDGVALFLTILTLDSIVQELDCTALEMLAGLWIAEAAHFHQLYAKKESRANCQKYAQQWVDEYAEKYGADAAIRAAEVVLQNSNY